jgi:hypothetical protein
MTCVPSFPPDFQDGRVALWPPLTGLGLYLMPEEGQVEDETSYLRLAVVYGAEDKQTTYADQ